LSLDNAQASECRNPETDTRQMSRYAAHRVIQAAAPSYRTLTRYAGPV
jgi:hypothetical protein